MLARVRHVAARSLQGLTEAVAWHAGSGLSGLSVDGAVQLALEMCNA